MTNDLVNHPSHYQSHPIFRGECFDYTRHMTFGQGNAFKYLWRMDMKGSALLDVRKAIWYLENNDYYVGLPNHLRLALMYDLKEFREQHGDKGTTYLFGEAMYTTALGYGKTAIALLRNAV